MPRKVTCTVSLELSEIDRLENISRQTRFSRSELIRQALATLFAKYEKQSKDSSNGVPRGQNRSTG
jgi:metal-responsive CopG/Arc/MetJ family transcriptional regulator